ncbi:MAG: hypothetical protein ACPL25_08245 [Ignavibacteria bacterium]
MDKEKEKLISRLVSKIENSRDLFPDLKAMERVTELEETASKLISIYRRLHKSHIDLEKISYQFVSDRDAIQSILRRFLQGNYRSGIISRKKPKIVFDDTTFTIYELKEPDVTVQEEKISEQPKESKIDLNEFLKEDKEDIVAIKSDDSENQIQISDSSTDKSSFEKQQMIKDFEETREGEQLEIDNEIARKSIEKKSEIKEDETEALVLPLQFEEEEDTADTILENENLPELEKSFSPFEKEDSLEEKETIVEKEELSVNLEPYSSQDELNDEEKLDEIPEVIETSEKINDQPLDRNLEDEEKETKVKEEIIENHILEVFQIRTTDNLFLDFEKSILQNILDVDDFLKKAVKESYIEDELFKLIQEAYKCFQLAKELDYEFISELIKVYWLALVAIRDHKIVVNKTDADLIRSTLIVLVSLIKGREIDLEPFMKNHNSLKEKLKQLEYEV